MLRTSVDVTDERQRYWGIRTAQTKGGRNKTQLGERGSDFTMA